MLALLAAAVTLGEWRGWPLLAGPLAGTLSARLGRPVTLDRDAAGTPFSLRFVGGIRLQAGRLHVAAPAWSRQPHTLLAEDLCLELRYIDLWRALRGQRLRIARLEARSLDVNAERLADGRASWQFGAPSAPGAPPQLPALGQLQIGGGALHWRDAPLSIDVQAQLARIDAAAPGVKLGAWGRYQHLPVRVGFAAVPGTPPGSGMALALDAVVGRATLLFEGSSSDPLSLAGLTGRYTIAGPSLAAVGRPVGLTLPTTGAFSARGRVVRHDHVWQTAVEEATVGASTLSGDFAYDAGRAVPLLSGQLRGQRLLLADLGPAVGTTPATTPSPEVPATVRVRHHHQVLPNRPFDLAALRAMDADVAIAIDELDLNTRFLEPLKPLRARLQLRGGVLGLDEIDARTGQGTLAGHIGLDGRGSQAEWSADLRWADVQLEHWVQQARAPGLPPYVAGKLAGRATLKGHGLSTGEILGTLEGELRSELRQGALSQLGVVAAGLDLAGGMGTLLRGDNALPVSCGVADMVASGGVLRPRLVLLETSVSAIWVEGTISLATEALDLRVLVSPKDFSLLSLRSPLHLGGTFAQPEVSLAKAALARKIGGAVLLGLLNPLAALAPLFDTGDRDAAARGAAGCRDLVLRHAAALKALPALNAASTPAAAASSPAPRR
jgi:uncharacterized protein involved in outer membrane biogenesis